MSAKKHVWTEPGPVDADAHEAAEARKGTAAANPVLSLAPRPPGGATRSAGTATRSAGTAARSGGTTARSAGTAARNGGPHPQDAAVPDHRSPAQIEADIAQTRNRLAGTLDELTERLTPRALMRRANAKARGVFVGRDGSMRKDRVAIAAGAVTSVVGGAVALRKCRPSR